jgi:hypothetical protein
METLRNWGIEFVCVDYIEITWDGNTDCSSLACASALVIVLSEGSCEEIGKREICPILKEKRLLVSVYLEHLWQNCHIIMCIESDSFWGYVGIHEPWEDITSEGENWANIDTDRKR